MLLRIVLIFLLAMAVIAMFGRWRTRGKLPPKDKPGKIPGPVICGKCGSYIIGKGDCACGAPRKDKG
ncbi:MAG TPA: hypothetical protein VLA78_07725 [Paracoccaceae bacterium]|jgi:hypothetical protein|nr:hypothetical protein [Paracoccaceae bacterium]